MSEMVEATLNGSYRIILPKHRADRPEWYTEEGWEKARLDSIHDYIEREAHDYKMTRGGPHHGDGKPRPVVFYVGAEEGDMCGLLSLWGAELVMFEPNKLVSPNIKAIWDANKLTPPIAYFEGFASNNTDLKGYNPLSIRSFPDSASGEVIGNHGFKELAYEADVIPQIKIDDLVEQINVKPDMITFDCEGSDWEVLKGAEQTIRDCKPVIYASIHPEFMFGMFNQYSRDFRSWIINLGYTETYLDYQHELHMVYTPIEDKDE